MASGGSVSEKKTLDEARQCLSTYTLANGRVVLAKTCGEPYRFSNQRQADRRVAELHHYGWPGHSRKALDSRSFYVYIEA